MDPSQLYNYEIVAYDNARVESEAANSNIDFLACDVSIEVATYTIIENDSLVLAVTGCLNGEIKWNTGQSNVREIIVRSRSSSVFFVNCLRSNGKETRVCSDYIEVNVLPIVCEDLKIVASKYDIEVGDEVILTVDGCKSEIMWDMGLGTSHKVSVYPNQNTVFKVKCIAIDGSFCYTSCKINVACNIDMIVGGFTEWKWLNRKKSVKVMAVTAYCNYNNLVLNDKKVIDHRNFVTITLDGGRDQTVIAKCGAGENACTKEVEIESFKRKCKDFEINARTEGNNLILETSGCSKGNTVIWNDSFNNKQFVVPIPTKNTLYRARCGRNNCETYYHYSSKPTDIDGFEVKMLSSPARILAAYHCEGTVFWSSEPKSNFASSGNNLTILSEPEKTTVYTATCKMEGNLFAQDSYTFKVEPKCSYLIYPESVNKGEYIKLQAVGCTGTPTWRVQDELIGEGEVITHVPISTTTYTMQCDSTNCQEQCTVQVNPSNFTIVASKDYVNIAEKTMLSSSGCSGGVVEWSTGETGDSIQVRPLTQMNYTASCILQGVVISERQVQISVYNDPPEDVVCPDFQLKVPEGLFPKDALIAIEPVNCPNDSKITWSDGVVRGPSEHHVVKLDNNMIVSATCLTPYQISREAEIAIQISNSNLSIIPSNVSYNVPTELVVSGCFYNETYQWVSDGKFKIGPNILVKITRETNYTVRCLDVSGTVTRSKDFKVTVTPPNFDCGNLGIVEFNGVETKNMSSSYFLVEPEGKIKMKFICDGCAGTLKWSINGEQIVNGVNGIIENQSIVYETIAPNNPGLITFNVNVNGCEKEIKVAVFNCNTYKGNIAWNGQSQEAVISASYCPSGSVVKIILLNAK